MGTIVTVGASPRVVATVSAAASRLNLAVDVCSAMPPREKLDTFDVLVLAQPDADLLRVVQRVLARSARARVVITADAERCARIREQLRFTTTGHRVQCLDSADEGALAAALEQVVERGERHASVQRTLTALNERITAAPPARARSATALLGTLLEVAPIGVAVVDASGVVREANPFATALLESGKSIVDRPLPDLFSASERDRIAAFLVRLGQPARRTREVFTVPGRSGTLHVELSGARLAPEAAEGGSLLLFQDITERTELVAQLHEANRRKDEFLAMLGHELRNPLAPIRTAVELLRLRSPPGIERERATIERQVNHLVQLVDDLLDVSRITRGNLELRRQHIEVADAVAHAIEMASPLLEQRRHTLRVSIPRTGLPVHADRARLAQIVANLLTNAAKYTDPGGSVDVEARRAGDAVLIDVRDSGRGIPQDLLPHVFDLFVQGRQTLERASGGLGLGLAIVRNLAEAHGGSVSVQSTQGAGSVFTVRLPIDPARAESHSAPPEAPVAGEAQPSRRVLVVDDNEDAAMLLGEILQTFGFSTALAHDGPRALEVAREFRPHVAVLDIGLPVMDGYELAQRLHAVPGLEQVRLIAVTGYGQQEDEARSMQAGFSRHLAKPVSIDDLRAAIEDVGPASRGA